MKYKQPPGELIDLFLIPNSGYTEQAIALSNAELEADVKIENIDALAKDVRQESLDVRDQNKERR